MPPRQRLSDADRGRALAWIKEGISLTLSPALGPTGPRETSRKLHQLQK